MLLAGCTLVASGTSVVWWFDVVTRRIAGRGLDVRHRSTRRPAFSVGPLEVPFDVGPHERVLGAEVVVGVRCLRQDHGGDGQQGDQERELRHKAGNLLVAEGGQPESVGRTRERRMKMNDRKTGTTD